jgi:DNA repair exonuclease SbcCD ATPase subunit
MIEILRSDYKGVISHAEGKYDFTDNCGLVVVSGHNKDSMISKDQNNGSGKSTFFGMIPNVRFEASPLADVKKRGLIHSKGSHITLDIKAQGADWRITQTANSYTIEKDGVDQKVRTHGGQKAKIAEIIPLTEDEWYSYVYLHSQKGLEFQQATTRVRMNYITTVWRLDQYDIMRKYFDKKVDEVKLAQNDFNIHSNTLLKLNDSLNANGWNRKKGVELQEATEVVKTLSKKVKKLQGRMQELRALKKQVEFYASTQAALKKLQKKAKHSKAELKEYYADVEAYEQFDEAMEEYTKTSKRLKKKLEELGGADIPKGGKKRIKELRIDIADWEKQEKTLSRDRDRHDDAKRELENLDDHVDNDLRSYLSMANKQKKDPMEMLKEELGIVKSTLALSDLLHEHEDGKCPTCSQSINVKDLETSLKHAKKRKGKLHSLIRALEIRNTRVQNKQIIDTLQFDERAFYALRTKIKKANKELDDLSDSLENSARVEEISEQLKNLKKPKGSKEKPKYTREQIEDMVESLNEIKSLKARLEEFEEVPEHEGIDAEYSNTKKKLKKLESKYEKAFKVTVKLGGKHAEFKLLSQQREDVNVLLDELRPLTEQLHLFKTLSKAYSNKGLKLHNTNNILYQLEHHYNRHASLIFAEPFKFSVTAKDDGVHIIVDRGNGRVSDVRELSGAESDSFRLLHFLACIIMAPAARRVNLAILDEPDSHMDAATASLFAERYIPFLRTLVPHIFLITQKGKHSHGNCSYLTIEKHKGVSRIKEGV